MSDHPAPDRILQTGLAFWPAKTLLSAIEPGLFTELAAGPQTLDVLSDRLSDCESGMRDAGFSSTRVEPLVGPDSMVVGIK